MDYAYTLQGWLKGMNTDSLSDKNDIGRDGDVSVPTRSAVARDVVGYAIHYYTKDFSPIGATTFDKDINNTSAFALATPQLFNGNIRAIALHNKKLDDGKPIGYAYSYDQLHRLKTMDAWKAGASANLWAATAAVNDFKERITYDGNGNIQTYLRNTVGSRVMDSLRYNYVAGTNKLNFVKDTVLVTTVAKNDVDNQAANNYVYDGAGNMSTDASQGVTVTWSPYGKINDVTKTGQKLIFDYTPTQQRVLKSVINGVDTTKSYYFRDAQGNVMGLHTRHIDSVSWKEVSLENLLLMLIQAIIFGF